MAKGKGAKKAGGPRAPAAQVTPQQLYARAQVALQHQDYDSARTALRKAVKLAPKNVEYVETLGALLAEVGPEEEALEVLKKAVTLSPDVGFEKYLYLGQLLPEPSDALAATRKGVQVLQAQHEAARAAGSPEATGLSRVLAGAMCSLSEALLGAAQVADAEAREAAAAAGGAEGASGSGAGAGAGVAAIAEEVEHLLALAATANPHSPEPGQVLASLRYEQGRSAEALEALRRSMALWHHPEAKEGEEEEEARAGRREPGESCWARTAGGGGDDDEEMGDAESSGSGEDSDSDDSEEEDDGPSYEFRMECAKLLLELDETTTTADFAELEAAITEAQALEAQQGQGQPAAAQ
ncbi:hypothetical protein GPECTOR_122g462 [Gonium pectorale]|uniref:Uncharacterized protein n=1 Tax=Gonium pectorale TaxID=33097 RepID=A0A150FYN6_GONPE|nr:hypothetical protein GPECTOR_122g462 [Gonium pectorale]|eukprot:KXZ42721.1 hypothetical protein GPECTOR_122g462 [Gonium pectorale]